jgi:uridine phosphorylase
MFPHYRGKYTKRPSVSPQYFVRNMKSRLPDTAILVYSSGIRRIIDKTLGSTRIASCEDKMFNSLGVYLNREKGFVMAYLPIGAPITGVATEELIARGVRRFLIVGFAGSLNDGIGHGNVVVCTKSIRDEGVSHHYARGSVYAYPTKEFTRSIVKVMRKNGIKFMAGPSWTIDAPYMETVDEIRHYGKKGVLTVEMESAALFAIVDSYRKKGMEVEASAIFIISDIVTKDIKDYEFINTRDRFSKYSVEDRVKEIATVIRDLKRVQIR